MKEKIFQHGILKFVGRNINIKGLFFIREIKNENTFGSSGISRHFLEF